MTQNGNSIKRGGKRSGKKGNRESGKDRQRNHKKNGNSSKHRDKIKKIKAVMTYKLGKLGDEKVTKKYGCLM